MVKVALPLFLSFESSHTLMWFTEPGHDQLVRAICERACRLRWAGDPLSLTLATIKVPRGIIFVSEEPCRDPERYTARVFELEFLFGPSDGSRPRRACFPVRYRPKKAQASDAAEEVEDVLLKAWETLVG